MSSRQEYSPIWTQDGAPAPVACDAAGCDLEGSHRAPKSRERADGFYHFCLDHVRAYNKAWDYFAGMSQAEIERLQREVSTWHRPTWPMGQRSGAQRRDGERIDDPFDLGSETGLGGNGSAAAEPGAARLSDKDRKSYAALDLEPSANLNQIKVRYKQLVKRFHPDANGGACSAEERLKHINEAYRHLTSRG